MLVRPVKEGLSSCEGPLTNTKIFEVSDMVIGRCDWLLASASNWKNGLWESRGWHSIGRDLNLVNFRQGLISKQEG